MRITTLIPKLLYTSGEIDDWPEVNKLDPSLIVSVGGDKTETPPRMIKRCAYFEYHFDDRDHIPDEFTLKRIAKGAAKYLKAGKVVLVHDKHGVNRVNLIAGLIVHYYDKQLTGEEIVKLIQARNPGAYEGGVHREALDNDVFRNYLEDL